MIRHSRGEEDRRQETMDNRSPMRAMVRRFFGGDDAEGQAMVEYSLIFVLIIIVCLGVLTTVASQIDDQFFQVVQAMP